MVKALGDFDLSTSRPLKENVFGFGVNIWQSDINVPGGIGLWIGLMDNGQGEQDIYSFLALVPRNLGTLQVLEGKKGWTEDIWRRKGLSHALLQEAAKISPLCSDFDGMTDNAYNHWISASEFTRRWWDKATSQFVTEPAVPALDKFTHYEQGARWILVIDPK
ncbi:MULTISPECIES: hypothetical protein [unclassified Duganella]|uniref:hypothetical protein n=1 Tax=unclassified Duganella TaxID=2636909 RepID=UPI000B898D54|nr:MULTISPECIES: hypothetical protein [unclassified Duganella]